MSRMVVAAFERFIREPATWSDLVEEGVVTEGSLGRVRAALARAQVLEPFGHREARGPGGGRPAVIFRVVDSARKEWAEGDLNLDA